MCLLGFFPCGCAHALHAVITSTQQNSTQNIDEQVDGNVDFLRGVAIAVVQNALPLIVAKAWKASSALTHEEEDGV